MGGAVTGEGGDRIVCDDPHNVQEAESDAIRKSTVEWWDVVMSTRMNNPRTAAKVVVMQRCHHQDLSGHLLEQRGWQHLCLPAEYEGSRRATSIGFVDPRQTHGELLWRDRFGPPEIESLKRSLGSYAAAGQLQQRPAPAEGGILKRQGWKFYGDVPANLDEVIQSWDCSFKDSRTADFVVGQVWGRHGADKYLLDQVRGRMDCPATIQAIRQMSQKWPEAHAKWIEDKANGPAVIAVLKHEIAGLIPIEPQGGKEVRAHAASAQIEAGNVYLPEPGNAPWINDFIEECAAFPNSAYDDQVDAMTQALVRFGVQRQFQFEPMDMSLLYRPSYFRM